MARGYRDELAALRARKEALEGEVAELRVREEELSGKEQQLVQAQERIQRLEAKLDQLEDDGSDRETARRQATEAQALQRKRTVLFFAVATVAAGVVVGVVFVRTTPAPPTSSFPSPAVERNGMPACMVDSTPSGVQVHGGLDAFIANGGDPVAERVEQRRLLGRTPVALTRMAGYEVELTKPGYRPMTLRIPQLDPTNLDESCTLRTTLEKESP